MDQEVTVLGRVKALALGLLHWSAPVLVRRSEAARLGLGLVLELALAQALVQALAEASQKALAWV